MKEKSIKCKIFFYNKFREEIVTDEILVATGRVPNVEVINGKNILIRQGLNLEMAGVKYDKNGVIVNDYLQTSNSNIYAAGDICSRYKFTVSKKIEKSSLNNYYVAYVRFYGSYSNQKCFILQLC